MNYEERKQNYLERIEEKFPNSRYEIYNFKGVRYPITIKCLKCGKERMISRAENLLTNKNLCSCETEPNLRDTGKELKNKIKYWYSNIGYKKYDIIKDFYSTSQKMILKCKKCNKIQNRNPKEILKDDRCLCCERKIVVKKTEQQFSKEIEQKYGNEYSLVSNYYSIHTKVLIKHNLCGKIYKVAPADFLRGHGFCPICRESKGEMLIRKFLEENNIKFISQFRADFFKKAPYDFYLPKFNLLIEFQGKQHFEPVSHFGGKEQFKKQVEIDKKKKALALENHYDILYISYLQMNYIKEILVQRLFREEVSSSELK